MPPQGSPRRRLAAVVVAAVLTLAAAAPEVAELAEQSPTDPAAAEALLAVDTVDGVPVDMANLLGDESGRDARLAALTDLLEPGGAVDEAETRSHLDEILSDPAYGDRREPFLERLLGPVFDWYERMMAWLWDRLLLVLHRLLGILDLAVLAWLGPVILAVATGAATFVLARRRAREIQRRTAIERILEMGTDPAELERMAGTAHDDGRYSESIRLRFVAGLLRLDAGGRIDFYPGLSNSSISAELADPGFDMVADQFDRVVYGRTEAGPDDARRAEAEWARLLGTRV